MMNQYDLQSTREGADPEQEDQTLLEEEPTPLERFMMIFTSPREAFAGLLNSTRLGAIVGFGILFTLITVIFATVATSSNPDVIRKQYDRQREKLEQRHERGEVGDKQYEQASKYLEQEPNTRQYLLFGLIGGIVVAPLMILFLGAVYYAVARILQTDQDTRLTYKTALAALCLAGIISGIATILQFVGLYVTGNPEFALDATLFSPVDSPVLRSVLHVTNPFTLWWIAVCGIGIASIAKTSWVKAAAIWGVIWIGGSALFAYIGSVIGFGA